MSKAKPKFGDQCTIMCPRHGRQCNYAGEGSLASLTMDKWDTRHKHTCMHFPTIDGKNVHVTHYWRGVKHEYSSTYNGKHRGWLDKITEAEAERQIALAKGAKK